jgi:serine/threonine protein kinase
MEEFLAKDICRHIYFTSSSSGDIVVKLTRSYSPKLHAFCARLGYAPKLYAYERLTGGIFAITMEYVTGEMLAPSSDPALQVKWITTLQDIVGNMHRNEFVHGDLRPPNIMVVKDELMLLDFDWGSKVGEAQYPLVRLNPQLEGCSMSSVDITKEDDDCVLTGTMNYIRGGD